MKHIINCHNCYWLTTFSDVPHECRCSSSLLFRSTPVPNCSCSHWLSIDFFDEGPGRQFSIEIAQERIESGFHIQFVR